MTSPGKRPILLSAIAFLVALSLHAGTYSVTSVADEGPGSFRQGLLDINSGACVHPCTISFAIPGPVPSTGYFTIQPLSPLPILFGDAITIDGDTQKVLTGDTNPFGPVIELDGSKAGFRTGIKLGRVVGMTMRGLAINRFEANGVTIENSSNITVTGCYIGVDPTASQALPNGFNGVLVYETFGGIRIEGNTISGNRGNGIYDVGLREIAITGNRIGNGRDHVGLGNGANGIDLDSQRSTINSNEIVANHDNGIAVGPNGGVAIVGNAIYANGLMSIDLGHDGPDPADPLDADGGANGHANAPLLTSATADAVIRYYYTGGVTFKGRVETIPSATVTIDTYAAPNRGPLGFAEANTWIASTKVQTDVHGVAEFTIGRDTFIPPDILLIPGGWLAATITTTEGTSELSAPVAIETSSIAVTTIADSGPGSLRDAITRANATNCSATDPCWITFDVPDDQLAAGVAYFVPQSPLPAITRGWVHLDGSSEKWRHGPANHDGPAVAILGIAAGQTAGLVIGTENERVPESLVYSIAVNRFHGDGIVVHASEGQGGDAYDVRMDDVFAGVDPGNGSPAGNDGDGIVIFGARSGGPNTIWTLRHSVTGSNGGNGLRLEAHGANIRDMRIGLNRSGSPRPNGAAGVLAGDGAFDVGLVNSTIAFNHGSGVVSTPMARAINIASLIFANDGLGIDRDANGVDSEASTSHVNAPTITSAVFDSAKNKTVIDGDLRGEIPALGLGITSSLQLSFFSSVTPDPSGFGEGEAPAFSNGGSVVTFTGKHFHTEYSGDLRGRFLTATASYTACDYELDCANRDTSEFSNAILVQ
jgi:parallel beta-helix repeat protein